MDYKPGVVKPEAQAFPLYNQLLKNAVSFCVDVKGEKHNNESEVLEAYYIQNFLLPNFLGNLFSFFKTFKYVISKKKQIIFRAELKTSPLLNKG